MPLDSMQGSLKERGVRLTRQRQILLELIDKTGEHLDAERLFQMAKEQDPKLNRVTVYRTLKMLKAGGLVDELDLMHYGGDQHYYETRLKQEHAHVICLRCGKVEEFFGDPLQKLRKQIETHFGFEILLTRTEVGGYCAHCQTLRARESRRTAAASREGQTAPARLHATRLTMEPTGAVVAGPEPASLVVTDPNGHRSRVPVTPLPFSIGRQPENHLVIRDSRVSRSHARIFAEDGGYVIEDSGSRHGTFLNGKRIQREALHNSDRIEFGAQDSYQLIFALDGAELKRIMEQVGASDKAAPVPGMGGNLAKLRAILDLARTLQSSFSIDDVLVSVVDTALAITGAERGFLLLRNGDGLQIRVARHRDGRHLQETDLRVPREVLRRALEHRRDLLSMNFDPIGTAGTAGTGESGPQNSIVDLELRSVTCVPLVRIRTGQGEATSVLSTGSETVGVLYMDSRLAAADLAGGNRELLQTLAIEASTVLENARLLEEERAKQQMQEELNLARSIQQSLLPKALPLKGWMQACGSSLACREVGGDYFDVTEVNPRCWSAVVADVSGKGVSSALLASLLQGALITVTDEPESLKPRMERLNQFLLRSHRRREVCHRVPLPAPLLRAFPVHQRGALSGLLVRPSGRLSELDATGMPVGLMEGAEFTLADGTLFSGDKLVIYSDGVTESQSAQGEFFGKKRLHDLVVAHAAESCTAIHDAIQDAVTAFAEGALQSDDITVLVLEFRG